ncbi:alpha/beta-hydrolase [Hesseltinella vesiculosa]|uniref:Alpha/beta-hydrolase n=1 Tax=Hesseltinella vesiculosa TaxID=101127 RepID=A0A1X2G7I9_9FUNG|nr:alpha/beta-hydrolase [Hesseltinella vesiculosa]
MTPLPVKACCTVKPVESDYEPVGALVQIDDYSAYVVGPEEAKKAIIVLYDIFGFHANTKQFCDALARERDYKVVMPDFFMGDYFSQDHVPSGHGFLVNSINWVRLISYIIGHATFSKTEPCLDKTYAWLKNQGHDTVGLVGFCWGGKRSIEYAAKHDFVVGAALIHPSMMTLGDFKMAKSPLLLIPTKDEPDLVSNSERRRLCHADLSSIQTPHFELLKTKPFFDKCKHVRYQGKLLRLLSHPFHSFFLDINHGFASARGDWTDEHVRSRVNDAIQETVTFFDGLFDV